MSKRRRSSAASVEPEPLCLPLECILLIFSFVRHDHPGWFLDMLTRLSRLCVVRKRIVDEIEVTEPAEPLLWSALSRRPLEHLLETIKATLCDFDVSSTTKNVHGLRRHITAMRPSDSFSVDLARYLYRMDSTSADSGGPRRRNLIYAMLNIPCLSRSFDETRQFLRFVARITLESRLLFPRNAIFNEYPYRERSFLDARPVGASLLRHVYVVDYEPDRSNIYRDRPARLTRLQSKIRGAHTIQDEMDSSKACDTIVARCPDWPGVVMPKQGHARRALVFEHCQRVMKHEPARGDDAFCDLVIPNRNPLLATRRLIDLTDEEEEEEENRDRNGYCHIYSETAKSLRGRMCLIIGGNTYAQYLFRLYLTRDTVLDEFYSLLETMQRECLVVVVKPKKREILCTDLVSDDD